MDYNFDWSIASKLSPRNQHKRKEIIKRRLSGEKLEAIAKDYGASRQRIQQVIRDYV